jgi:hypothetical protein
MRRLQRENAAGLLQLLQDWEQAKVTAEVERGRDGTVRFACPLVIAIPPAVWEALDEAARARLTEQADGEPRRLVLDPEFLRALFDTVTTGIVASVAGQLGDIRRAGGPGAEPEAIVLVGGLAASAYVQEALRRRFGGEYRVLVPASPALAVLEGAVHHAYDPRELASRRSRYTYGLALAMPWEAGADSPARRLRGKDQAMLCRDRFAVAVRRLDRVAVDEPFPFVVEPAFTESHEVTVQLFKTRAADPRYVDEEGCELAGELKVDVSETAGQAERPLALLLYFGRSQVQVEAIDLTTGTRFQVAIEFERMLLRASSMAVRRAAGGRGAAAARAGNRGARVIPVRISAGA